MKQRLVTKCHTCLDFGLLSLRLDVTHFGLVAASSRVIMSEYNYKTRLNKWYHHCPHRPRVSHLFIANSIVVWPRFLRGAINDVEEDI